MAKAIRYTCSKKAFPSFHSDCLECEEYNPCVKGGKWCFIAAMENDHVAESAGMDAAEDAAQPVLRDTRTIPIYIGDGQTVDVLREDIEKSIRQELYKGLGLMYGA